MGVLEGATPIQSLLVNYSEAAAAALEVAAAPEEAVEAVGEAE